MCESDNYGGVWTEKPEGSECTCPEGSWVHHELDLDDSFNGLVYN